MIYGGFLQDQSPTFTAVLRSFHDIRRLNLPDWLLIFEKEV